MLEAKEFFAGKVRAIDFESGTTGRAAVGVVSPGEYSVTTAGAEEITIISGAANVLLPGSNEWQVFMPGECFYIPARSEYWIQIADTTSYFCRYRSAN